MQNVTPNPERRRKTVDPKETRAGRPARSAGRSPAVPPGSPGGKPENRGKRVPAVPPQDLPLFFRCAPAPLVVDWPREGRDGDGTSPGTRRTAGAGFRPGAPVSGRRPAAPGPGLLPPGPEPGRSLHGLRCLGSAGLRHGPERGQLARAVHQLGQRTECAVCLCAAAADGPVRPKRDGASPSRRAPGHPLPVPVLAHGQAARRPGHGTLRPGLAGG